VSRGTLARPALPPGLDPRRPRRGRSPLRRLSLGAGALLSLAVFGVSSVGWAAYRHFDSAVTRAHWHIGGNRPAEAAGDMNLLLLGDDSRDGTGGEYGKVDGVRSDTTIIAHFDKNGTATLLSFPRDTLLPVVPQVKGTPRDGRDKLTNILSYADVPGLVTTLESSTGLKINHTVTIDLAGFKKMTDAVGGVTVCVTRMPDGSTRNLNDQWSQWHGQLGQNHLNGDQALAFVRTRHALGDERLRVLRQQQFLSKLLAAATSAGVLTNPAKITQLLGAVGGALKVDEGLNQTEMLKLAKRISQLGGGKVKFITVPTHVPMPSEGAIDDKGTVPPHGNVLVLDQAEMTRILTPLRPASENGGQDGGAAPTLPRGQVMVAKVLNASGRTGLAARTVESLQALGFRGTMTTGTRTTAQTATEVRYPQGQAAAAHTLAAVVPGAQAVPDTTGTRTGLTLVLGSSFTGVTGAAAGALATTARTDGTAGAAAAGASTARGGAATGTAGGGSGTTSTQPSAGPTAATPSDTSCTP
jgi:LCP family protein required for cell wall assembly